MEKCSFFDLLFICSIFFGFKYEQKKHSPSKVFILGNHSLNWYGFGFVLFLILCWFQLKTPWNERISPLKIGENQGKSSSNHPFSGAMMLVSGRVIGDWRFGSISYCNGSFSALGPGGLDWIPCIPLWKGMFLRGTSIWIPNHREPISPIFCKIGGGFLTDCLGYFHPKIPGEYGIPNLIWNHQLRNGTCFFRPKGRLILLLLILLVGSHKPDMDKNQLFRKETDSRFEFRTFSTRVVAIQIFFCAPPWGKWSNFICFKWVGYQTNHQHQIPMPGYPPQSAASYVGGEMPKGIFRRFPVGWWGWCWWWWWCLLTTKPPWSLNNP